MCTVYKPGDFIAIASQLASDWQKFNGEQKVILRKSEIFVMCDVPSMNAVMWET